MKKIAKVSVSVHAPYSGATYEETLFADYEKVKDLDGESMYFCELDGKHSELEEEINVELVDDNYFENNCEPDNDGDSLYWHIVESRELGEEIFIKPVFGKIKKEVICTPEQWAMIEGIIND